MDRDVRILYAGDDPDTAERLAASEARFAVTRVSDRASVTDRLEETAFDCVVAGLDPEAGLDVLSAVREAYPDLPCLLYTDFEGPDAVESAFAVGATDCVRRSGSGQVVVLARRVRDHVAGDRDQRVLRERSELLEELFEQVPIYLYVKDREGRFRWVSEFYDDAPSDPIGKTDLELFPEAGAKTYRDDVRVIETGEPLLNEEEYISSTGHYNLTSKVPWYGRDGEIKGLIGVTREISELERYRRQLERQNRRLEEFAAIVSHDLRNPLQVVQARLEMLDDDVDHDHLTVATDAADRMAEIISETLRLARQGESVGELEHVALADVATRCWDAIETESARLDLADPPVLPADRSRVRTLLENLFSNAVEHTDEGVTVTVGRLPDGFYVADDGEGIPADRREDIFDVHHSGATDGTGFGLAIVGEVVTAHGWTVSVTGSESGGARFEVTGVETLEPGESV
jgi:signal transduction histidine kinase